MSNKDLTESSDLGIKTKDEELDEELDQELDDHSVVEPLPAERERTCLADLQLEQHVAAADVAILAWTCSEAAIAAGQPAEPCIEVQHQGRQAHSGLPAAWLAP